MNSHNNPNPESQTAATNPEIVNAMTDEMAEQIEQEINQPGADENPSMTDVPNEPLSMTLDENPNVEVPVVESAVTEPITTEPIAQTVTEAPTKRAYKRHTTGAQQRRIERRKVAARGRKKLRTTAEVSTTEEPVRKRRKKLSPAVRKIETNVLRHLTREVRHTGVGWHPPLLDPAWKDAVVRMEKDGIIENREDMGGYVPRKFISRFATLNNQVLAYVKNRFRSTKQGVKEDRLLRARQAALIRLEKGGKVTRTRHGYVPVEDNA